MPANAAVGVQKISFTLDPTYATGSIQIDPSSQPQLLLSLANDGPLPDGDNLIVGGDLQVTPGQEIAVGPAKVSFSADVNAALGIYSTRANLRDALLKSAGLVSQVADQITLPAGDKLLMLRWGYDISGTVSGTVALAPSTNLSFSGSGETKGYFAIVQGAAANAKARSSLTNLIQSWKLPSQANDITKLPSSTALISEVDGSFSLGATVTFGYDFNWIRAIDTLGLKGDIGLKLEAGLSASLGVGMTGKFAVMLSRETADPVIRMRLYKLRINNWNFGFDASVTATGQVPAPASLNDLIKAVTGTHQQQIMKLLGQVEDWTDPNTPIFGPFVNMVDSEAQRLIQSLTGVADLAAAFNTLTARIKKLFDLWDNLPQAATQFIWSKLPDKNAIATIAAIAKQVSNSSDDELKTLVQSKLADVPFLNTPQGQALSSLAVDGLFSVLQNTNALADLKKFAGQVAGILDGSDLQTFLTNLQAAVNTKLDLAQLESVVDQASFDSLDTWLKARLEDFLEQKLVGAQGLAEITKLRDGLHAILSKADDLYSKAVAALQKSYTFSFNETYESTATTSALIDATFDFSSANSRAGDGLKLALSGKFDQLLQSPPSGVTIADGVLAYGLHKETHVSVSLPFFSTSSLHVNDAVAQLQTITTDGGGLIFSLQATDVYSVRNDFSSALTIALAMPASQNQVRMHSGSASYRYDFKVRIGNLTSAVLNQQFAPYANAYFSDQFKALPPGTFADWSKQIAPPSGKLGNALVTLSVSLPSSAANAWSNAPGDQRDPAYKKMSMSLQRQFKQALHDAFFSDIHNYQYVSGDTVARAVLAFCSIPACSDVELVNDGDDVEFLDETASGKNLYWDYGDRGVNIFSVDLREKVLFHPNTIQNLLQKLHIAQLRIQAAGDPDGVLGSYMDDQAGQILAAALHGQLLDYLFPVEGNLVDQARAAGIKMASFRTRKFTNPDAARKDFAAFGQKLSDDFNANLKVFALDTALMPLGTAIYAAGALALDPAASATIAAMFTVQTLRPGISTITPADTDVLDTQVVVHAPSAA